MPRLPIPKLEESLEKYVKSLEALEGHPDITREDIENAKQHVQGIQRKRSDIKTDK